MPLDSRRSPKSLPSRALQVSAEPTLRDIPLAPVEPPSKRVLPWMGLILFCTGAVFQAGRLVERLDPQPLPSRGALTPGVLAADVARGAPATVTAPAARAPELPPEALGKLMAERAQAQELARQAWQKQVEAEVAAQVARLGEASSQQQQLETDAVARQATQEASEAEAKVRALELQLATKTAELEEARLRAENAWLRAELVRERSGQPLEAPVDPAAPTAEAPEAAAVEGPVAAAAGAPAESAPPAAPASALEPAPSPAPTAALEPAPPPASPPEPPQAAPEPTTAPAEARPTM